MDVKETAASLPAKPGIYLFKNRRGEVIYVGKARSLAARVRTYFQPTDDPKVRHIVAETAAIDYLLTGSEREAAFVENNFIQQFQPKYNLRLKDDKSFPYLRVTVKAEVPGIDLGRKAARDGSRYFGPFSPAREARKTIGLVAKHFRIRTCQDAVFKGRKRPCLNHDLKLCSGPCVGLISQAEYADSVRNAVLFLEGRGKELAGHLKESMRRAAEAERFEEAAHWRDVLRTLEHLRAKPGMISVKLEDQDIVGYAQSGPARAFHVFLMRRGKVREAREAGWEEADASPPASLRRFLESFYGSRPAPKRVLVPFAPERADDLSDMLAGRAGRKVEMAVPARGRGRALLDLAGRNAESLLRKSLDVEASLEELKSLLGLSVLPVRIEGFDVSDTSGTETVASLVVFRGGWPDKAEYRKYKIKTVAGPNDVASLAEAVRRRYLRRLEEKTALPDLILVDGGKPQLGAARKVLEELGLAEIPLAALAKREEIIFSPAHPDGLRLDRTGAAQRLLQYVRDEAHRFAVAFHRRRRAKRAFN
ncbi:MAG: excinuclease ABC subunit UvrC [Candidatus Aminicenantes bacterium]|nr:excinuclease ABC subunit UvrC [Candidatus Aminicenantes bacterium]